MKKILVIVAAIITALVLLGYIGFYMLVGYFLETYADRIDHGVLPTKFQGVGVDDVPRYEYANTSIPYPSKYVVNEEKSLGNSLRFDGPGERQSILINYDETEADKPSFFEQMYLIHTTTANDITMWSPHIMKQWRTLKILQEKVAWSHGVDVYTTGKHDGSELLIIPINESIVEHVFLSKDGKGTFSVTLINTPRNSVTNALILELAYRATFSSE